MDHLHWYALWFGFCMALVGASCGFWDRYYRGTGAYYRYPAVIRFTGHLTYLVLGGSFLGFGMSLVLASLDFWPFEKSMVSVIISMIPGIIVIHLASTWRVRQT